MTDILIKKKGNLDTETDTWRRRQHRDTQVECYVKTEAEIEMMHTEAKERQGFLAFTSS